MMASTIPGFITQDYPADRRQLIILDEAGELKNETGQGWQIISIFRINAKLRAHLQVEVREGFSRSGQLGLMSCA
jgi:hypothetical protein